MPSGSTVTVVIKYPEELSSLIGRPITSIESIIVTQEMIDKFCAISGDHQWIHKQANSPSTAPGNLLITLLPRFIQTAIQVESFSRCVTARYKSIRFRQPVIAGDRLEATIEVTGVKNNSDKTYCEYLCKLVKNNTIVVEARVTDVYYC